MTSMADHTTPSDATLAEEATEAHEQAGPGSISESDAAAVDGHQVDPAVAAAEKAANERGANVKGEGELP